MGRYFNFSTLFLMFISLFSVSAYAGRAQQQNPLFLEASQLSGQLNSSSLDAANKASLSKRFDDIKRVQQELWVLSGRIDSGECVLDCIPKYRKIFPGWESDLKSYIADARNSLAKATPQNPASAGQQAAVADKPITCGHTAFRNLTPDQGKGLKFLLEKRYKSPEITCITEIASTDKFPLRGQTLVKYKINLVFPNGYRTDCLQLKTASPQEQQGFNAIFKQIDCSDIGMAPATAGETRKEYTEA